MNGRVLLKHERVAVEDLGWAQALAPTGVVSHILRIWRARDDRPASELGLERGEVTVVERTGRIGTGAIVSYERSAIPRTAALNDLPERGLEERSLIRTLAGTGLSAEQAQQSVRASALDIGEASLVDRPAGTWSLRSGHTSWTADGHFAERAESLLDPTHYELRIRFGEGR